MSLGVVSKAVAVLECAALWMKVSELELKDKLIEDIRSCMAFPISVLIDKSA